MRDRRMTTEVDWSLDMYIPKAAWNYIVRDCLFDKIVLIENEYGVRIYAPENQPSPYTHSFSLVMVCEHLCSQETFCWDVLKGHKVEEIIINHLRMVANDLKYEYRQFISTLGEMR